MPYTLEPLRFPVTLTLSAHHRAKQQFQSVTPLKAKQVYLNTLAVYAVDFYLQCQGFETNFDSLKSDVDIMHTFMDIAALEIKKYGTIECRPLLPQEQICSIPPEVWEGRIAYVVVELDESLKEATLLGFVHGVSQAELPLNQLQPLEDLTSYLDGLGQSQTGSSPVNSSSVHSNPVNSSSVHSNPVNSSSVNSSSVNSSPVHSSSVHSSSVNSSSVHSSSVNSSSVHSSSVHSNPVHSNPVHLNQWFDRIFSAGWQTLDTLFGTEAGTVAMGLRSPGPLHQKEGVKAAKLIDLGMQLDRQPVTLLVALIPEEDKRVGIRVQLHPVLGETHLPPNLALALLSGTGETLREVPSRALDNFIQLPRFKCTPGEGFSIQVTLGDTWIREDFTV